MGGEQELWRQLRSLLLPDGQQRPRARPGSRAAANLSAARRTMRSACDGWGAGPRGGNGDHCCYRMDSNALVCPTWESRCAALTSRPPPPPSAGPRAECPPPFRISPDCPTMVRILAHTYPFYYQDDPNADDLPSSLSSYINGFETRGRSYFVGADELRAMPLDISQLEICAVARGLCVASCLSLRPTGLCTMHRDQWLERRAARFSRPCGWRDAADRSLPAMTTQTRANSIVEAFTRTRRACRAGRRPPAMRTRVGRAPAAAKWGATIRNQVRLLGTLGLGSVA